jgi:hypothetical protein
MISCSCFGKTIFWSEDLLISFILATADFVGRNEGMKTKVTRLSLFGNQSDNDSLSSYKII